MKGILYSIIYLFLILTIINNVSAGIVGTWTFKTVSSSETATLYVCQSTDDTIAPYQGRYELTGGNTIGFIWGNVTDNVFYGNWVEAGVSSGTFEIDLNNNMVTQWWEYQSLSQDVVVTQNTTFVNVTDQGNHTINTIKREIKPLDNRYDHVAQKFTATQSSTVAPNAVNQCFLSTTADENIKMEGSWTKGAGIQLFACVSKTYQSAGGRFFNKGYWRADTYADGMIMVGRFFVSSTAAGNMLLKRANGHLMGIFFLGYENKASSVAYETFGATTLSKNVTATYGHHYCIDMTYGIGGVWSESLHKQAMHVCSFPTGDFVGAYTRQVLVNSASGLNQSLPIGIIRGQVSSSTHIASGSWFEAGRNQNGIFDWKIDKNATSFAGNYWSDEAKAGIGIVWAEKRLAWVASPKKCLEHADFLGSNSTSTFSFNSNAGDLQGMWSFPSYPKQIHPTLNVSFADQNMTLCMNATANTISGIYREKGDFVGTNQTLDGYLSFGYFKEYWTPLNVKIAGNVLLQFITKTYAVGYYFESPASNNDLAKLGHIRWHTKLQQQPDVSSLNCTVVFYSSASSLSLSILTTLCVFIVMILFT